ncbi:hypothetical protein IHE44_0002383 [Lamprotornis superbus]|uniref:Uncharacterized protein n=1 Tax=Lamprotornis superbus TaxID=245042 RepID=A0A835NVR1_9PASS|nr:hypothetical protein IHE44_0002383 [Lamprotornis superbus]
MAELCVGSILVTGANRGLGLGFVQHFLRMPKPPQWIFATCWDPKGQRAQVSLGWEAVAVLGNGETQCQGEIGIGMVFARGWSFSWAPVAQELQNLAAKHPNLIIIALEVTNPASIKAAAAKVGEHLGDSGLNLLINNAGMVKSKMLDAETLEDMTDTPPTLLDPC